MSKILDRFVYLPHIVIKTELILKCQKESTFKIPHT